jgi:hypothetical protein
MRLFKIFNVKIMIIIMGSDAVIYNIMSGKCMMDVPIYKTMISVKNIELCTEFKILTIIGKNYHETFEIVSIVKIFGDLFDDKGLLIMKNNE